MDKTISLSGFWERTSKAGKKYMSASTSRSKLIAALQQVPGGDKINLMLFTNTKRPDRNDPDANLSAGEFVEREKLPHVAGHAQPSTQPPDDHGF
jgi:hypothetical protein